MPLAFLLISHKSVALNARSKFPIVVENGRARKCEAGRACSVHAGKLPFDLV
jgi:hypothetical protein